MMTPRILIPIPDPDPDPVPDPVTGDPDDDRLHGNDRDDGLNGGGGNDVLYGSRGDDVLKGGPGIDSYEGGPGNDVILVDYFDFTDGKEPPMDAIRMMAQGVFDGGENDDGTADGDTLSFADFTDEDGDGVGVTVDMTNARVTYKGSTTASNFSKTSKTSSAAAMGMTSQAMTATT